MRKNSGFQFEQKIKSELALWGITPDGHELMVGLSGGPDSICLVHVLSKLGYKVIAAHVNYKLRGVASDQDEKFTATWCLQKGIELVHTSFDTKTIAAKQKEGLEETARKLRYNWFGSICKERKIIYVLTGHHLNDQAELILMNLIRGTGLEGVKGMLFNSSLPYSGEDAKLFLLRPLLSHSKEEILEYLRKENIDFRIDASNEQSEFTRNKIRNQILPVTESININAVRHIAEFGNKVQAFLPFYYKHISNLRKKLTVNIQGEVKVKVSAEINEYSLFYLLSPYGFNEDTVKQMYHSVRNQNKGRKFISTSHTAYTGNMEIDIISRISVPVLFDIESIPFSVFYHHIEFVIQESTVNSLPSLNGSIINGEGIRFPLTLRNWLPGDRMKPLGMKGSSKKIKDILTDHKISGADKKAALVLLNKGEIIWLYPSNTISETVKIKGNTKKYFCIATKPTL
ncbi:MAG: tRNA lysidine(34) synthetase TilS [Saprospiraceae bacterium]|nr:tRNA lysidine(34) synthetase TilS [Saprospiraceae bacterium]